MGGDSNGNKHDSNERGCISDSTMITTLKDNEDSLLGHGCNVRNAYKLQCIVIDSGALSIGWKSSVVNASYSCNLCIDKKTSR